MSLSELESLSTSIARKGHTQFESNKYWFRAQLTLCSRHKLRIIMAMPIWRVGSHYNDRVDWEMWLTVARRSSLVATQYCGKCLCLGKCLLAECFIRPLVNRYCVPAEE